MKDFGKGFASGVKGAVKFAGKVKKIVSEEELGEAKKKPSVHDDYYDPMEDPHFDPHEAEATRGQSGRGTKGKMNVRKKYPVKEAKVDAGKSPETKEKDRNVRKFGVSHNVSGHGKIRRSLHKMNRGDKKIKGDKSAWVEMESTIPVVVEKDLNAAERRALPNKDFVFPGKGEGPEGKQ